jgi:hypothetical protein
MSLLEQNEPDIENRAQVTIDPSSQGGVQQRMRVVTTLMRYRR